MQEEGSTAVEEWRAVVGYEGRYEVSDQGRVRSTRTGRAMRFSVHRGYSRVKLRSLGVSRWWQVHRLVLAAFVGACPSGCEASHNNGVRSDNRATNLRWDTRTNNHADKVRHGTAQRGERGGGAKLTTAQVHEIRAAVGRGESHRAVGARFAIHSTTVTDIVNRKRWAHV